MEMMYIRVGDPMADMDHLLEYRFTVLRQVVMYRWSSKLDWDNMYSEQA
jgi:hypothetical protein